MSTISLAVELSLDKTNDIITFLNPFTGTNDDVIFLRSCASLCKKMSEDNAGLNVSFTVNNPAFGGAEFLNGSLAEVFDRVKDTLYRERQPHHSTQLMIVEDLKEPVEFRPIRTYDTFELEFSNLGKNVEFILWHSIDLSLEYRSGKFSLENILKHIVRVENNSNPALN
jgi:hypothetical protein